MPSYNMQGELIATTITMQEHNPDIRRKCWRNTICFLIVVLVIALIAVNSS